MAKSPRALVAGGVSVVLLAVTSVATAQPILAVRTAASPAGQQRLVAFDSLTPTAIDSDVAITGLEAGETIVAVDFFRDFSSETLYALGSTSRLYTLNTGTGAATQVGSGTFTPALSGTKFGFVAGEMCGGPVNGPCEPALVTSNTGQFLKLDLSDASATDQGPLTYATDDANFGTAPTIAGIAKHGDFLVAVDTALDIFATLDAGSAELTALAPLSPASGPKASMAMSQGGNPYVVIDQMLPNLHRVDFAHDAATTQLGIVGGAAGFEISGGITLPLAPPVLQATPTPVDFGDQPLGTMSPVHTLTITLAGGDALESFNVATGGADRDDFFVTTDFCANGDPDSAREDIRLRWEGDSCTVKVRFAPSALGARNATYRFLEPKCCPDPSIFEVPLTGNGTNAPIGPAGPAGADGADGADGAQGPAGPAGPQGAAGSQGPAGSVGPAGPAGPQGPPGPTGKVTCVVKKKGTKVKVTCTVRFRAANAARVAMRLSSGGRLYALGLGRRQRSTTVSLRAIRPLHAGRTYRLTMIFRNGRRTTTFHRMVELTR
jgi:hypothetical protein